MTTRPVPAAVVRAPRNWRGQRVGPHDRVLRVAAISQSSPGRRGESITGLCHEEPPCDWGKWLRGLTPRAQLRANPIEHRPKAGANPSIARQLQPVVSEPHGGFPPRMRAG
jgi:hypothetical protein